MPDHPFDRNTLLHLRIPFSFSLLPVFCFAASQAHTINWINLLAVFFILHFFIYPGSNVYNSYMDRDEGSIGGLKYPPPVNKNLYYASLLLDTAGLLMCFIISWKLFLLMLVYVGISKAYSWEKIRLKKYGIVAWTVVMLFQGGYTFLLANMSIENQFEENWLTHKNSCCMLIASLLIGSFYPLTQIYQHQEDYSRGDLTISYKLGIRGTFIFSAILFFISYIVSWLYFSKYYSWEHFLVFSICLFPVVAFFSYWFGKTLYNRSFANYAYTMRMVYISSACMMLAFGSLFYLNFG